MSRSCLPVLLIGFPLLSGCAALQLGVVNHAGPIAESQWRLYLVVGFVLIFVALPVLLLTPLMAWHYRLSNRHGAFRPRWNFSWVLEAFIWIPPTAIVIGLAFILWTSTHELDPYRAISSEQPTLEVEAAALDWKWLFIYPREKIAVLNQLAIPVGRPVHISLTSGTVMQSLLIPQLAGQIYAMAGMTTELNLAADRLGIFRGENTQFNGEGFQDQKFDVLALGVEDYKAWLIRAGETGKQFDATAFDELFERNSPPAPVFYAFAPDDLFQHIRVKALEPKR